MFKRLRKKKADRRFFGYDWYGLDHMLDVLCQLEDNILVTDEENEALDIGIQSLAQIMNRMKDGKEIFWDD